MWFIKSAKLRRFKYLTTLVFSTIAIIGLQGNHYQQVIKKIDNTDYLQQERESLTALNLRKLIPNFGFGNLAADSIYLEFIQYFGHKQGRQATGYSLVPEYFAAIADRDPHFTDAYLTLSTANSMYAGKADKTIIFMDRILESNHSQGKNSYLIWALKAMDESLFFGDVDAARNSYQKAAELALQQSEPQYLNISFFNRKRAKFLATKPDTTKSQIIAWKSVLPHVVKEDEKQVIRDRIEALEARLD